MSINLYFPQLNGGVEQGLNDAGIETFEGEYQQHIVRECTQNALDARFPAGGHVRIVIQLRHIPVVIVSWQNQPNLIVIKNGIWMRGLEVFAIMKHAGIFVPIFIAIFLRQYSRGKKSDRHCWKIFRKRFCQNTQTWLRH